MINFDGSTTWGSFAPLKCSCWILMKIIDDLPPVEKSIDLLYFPQSIKVQYANIWCDLLYLLKLSNVDGFYSDMPNKYKWLALSSPENEHGTQKFELDWYGMYWMIRSRLASFEIGELLQLFSSQLPWQRNMLLFGKFPSSSQIHFYTFSPLCRLQFLKFASSSQIHFYTSSPLCRLQFLKFATQQTQNVFQTFL